MEQPKFTIHCWLCSLVPIHEHIPHMTNFERLVGLVVSCGHEDLEQFRRLHAGMMCASS